MEKSHRGITIRHADGGIRVIKLHYSADPCKDPVLNPSWIETHKPKAPSEEWWNQEQEIDFGARQGSRVYHAFKDDETQLVDPFPIPQDWTRYFMLDTHPRKPHAMLWCAISPQDEAYAYRELWPSKVYATNKNIPEDDNNYPIKWYCEAVKWLESGAGEMVDIGGKPMKGNPQNKFGAEKIHERIIDYAARAFGKDRDNPDAIDYQERYEKYSREINHPFYFEDCIKDNEANYAEVNEWLRPRPRLDKDGELTSRSKLRIFKNLPELRLELLANRVRMLAPHQVDIKDPEMKVIEKRNDLTDCIAEGSLIATLQGDIPIEDVRIGDMVLTRAGYRRVTDAWKVSDSAKSLRLTTSDGKKLVATPDHRVFTHNKGWVTMDCLEYGDILDVCTQRAKLLYGEALDLGGIWTQNAERIAPTSTIHRASTAAYCFIVRFGNQSTARFLRVVTSITKMGTLSTMPSRIWNVFAHRLTLSDTCEAKYVEQHHENACLSSRKTRLRSGTDRKLDLSGTQRTVSGFGESRSLFARFVPFAAISFSRRILTTLAEFSALQTVALSGACGLELITNSGFVSSAVNLSSLTSTTKSKHAAVRVMSVRPAGQRAVYDLTIDGDPEFYANGILVHNCLKYYCAAQPKYYKKVKVTQIRRNMYEGINA